MDARLIQTACSRYLLLFLLLLLLLPAAPVSAVDGVKKSVLLLHSYHSGMRWADDVTRGVHDQLNATGGEIDLHIEYMDTKKIPYDADYRSHYFELLKHKYSDTSIDLIIASDNNAFDFIRENRDTLFAHSPVVFCGVNFFHDSQLKGVRNITGVAEIFDAYATVKQALTLHPGSRHLVVINDDLPTGRAWRDAIKAQLAPLQKRLQISYINALTMSELLQQLRALESDALVLLGVYFRDKAGTFFEPDQSTRMIADATTAPVYGLLDFNLGHGIVGGNLINGYAQGEQAARLGARILAGEDADSLPVIKQGSNVWMFDLVEMQRFALDESQLPVGSTTVHRELVALSKQEQQWLKQHPELLLAPDPAFPPYEFFDKSGKFRGIASDYMALIEARLGIRFKTVQMDSWSQILDTMKQGRIELISAVNRTDQRAAYMAFTEPYLRYPFVIVANQNNRQKLTLAELKDKRVAVVNRYAIHDFLKQDHPELKLIPVADYQEGLRSVSTGQNDVFIANLASVSYYIEQQGIINLHIAGESGYFSNLAIAVRKDLPQLVSILNKALKQISEEERAVINSRWIRLGADEAPWWQLSRTQLMILGGSLLLLIIITFIIWNYYLRRTVEERTAQLSKTVTQLDSTMRELRLIVDNAQIGIAYVIDRKIVWVNRTLAEQCAMSEAELTGEQTRIFYESDEAYERVGRAYADKLARGGKFDDELPLRFGNRGSFWCRLIGQAVDADDPARGSIWLLQDISVQKVQEGQLKALASSDPLTGVYNRRGFFEMAEREVKRCQRTDRSLSLLMLDLDHFKQVNDCYGHKVGDEVLRRFTATVEQMLRASDVFGRLGGEEFAVVLPESDLQSSLHVAERILKRVAAEPLHIDEHTLSYTVSIGLLSLQRCDQTLDQMLQIADEALYEAKGQGRNRISHRVVQDE